MPVHNVFGSAGRSSLLIRALWVRRYRKSGLLRFLKFKMTLIERKNMQKPEGKWHVYFFSIFLCSLVIPGFINGIRRHRDYWTGYGHNPDIRLTFGEAQAFQTVLPVTARTPGSQDWSDLELALDSRGTKNQNSHNCLFTTHHSTTSMPILHWLEWKAISSHWGTRAGQTIILYPACNLLIPF